jgi:hypothetical protein
LSLSFVQWAIAFCTMATGKIQIVTGIVQMATGKIQIVTGIVQMATGKIQIVTGKVQMTKGNEQNRKNTVNECGMASLFQKRCQKEELILHYY